MKFSYPKSLLTLLSGLCLMAGSLIANDPDTPTEDLPLTEDHIPVRSRHMALEKRESMDRRRANEREQVEGEEEKAPLYRQAKLIGNSHQSQFRLAPNALEKPQFQLSSYPTNCHWLTSIGDTGKTLEMEDGSHWEIVSADQYMLNYWRRGDNLVVTPNYDWFSSGDYFITNKNSNSYVRANLHIGPLAFGQYSHWIVAIDHMSGHITLENGVTWCIYAKDSYVFREWEVNDHIIIGLYNNWFHSFDHILINVNMDTHVRAKQY